MKTLLLTFLRTNWLAVGKFLLSGTDWAGVLARVFSYLLKLALRSGRYEAVRLLASRVIEQARFVLAVTDDGVVSKEEAEKAVATARRLFDAWAEGKGKGVTRPIVEQLQDAVGEVTQ
jgi:hypothetical protein